MNRRAVWISCIAAPLLCASLLADTKPKDSDAGSDEGIIPSIPVGAKKETKPAPKPVKEVKPARAARVSQPPAAANTSDVILRAMKDEILRSRDLSLADEHTPYFIEYTLEDINGYAASASMGGLLSSTSTHARVPLVRVRVGDYKFDNSNYLYSDYYSGTRYDPNQFPLDDNYNAFRRCLWLATDRQYKTAVEAIARKKAALQNVTQDVSLPDFWKMESAQKITAVEHHPVDMARLNERAKSLSRIFEKYPEVLSSVVSVSGTDSIRYQLNSEGTTVRVPDGVAHVIIRGWSRASDGMAVRDSIVVPAKEMSKLPSDAELQKDVTAVADHVKALATAPAGEAYSGPVLFEGVAAAQLFGEVLGPNFTLPRKPVAEQGRAVPFLGSEFEGRVGSRVLPDSFDVIDDPLQTTFEGQPLLGAYTIDEEGTVPKPLTLVEKGSLKTFLLTRQPVKGYEGSNGHARIPSSSTTFAAAPSNLFIKTSQPMPEAELKKKLMDMVKQRNKPYGLIVRKMDYPSSASGAELRRILASEQSAGASRPVSVPLLVYRVYPDGREELVRGLRFRSLNARSLKDITAAGDKSYLFSYLYSLAPFSMVEGSSYVAPVSVVAPSILFDDVDLERPQEDMPKLPVVPPPPLTASVR